ncbi:hypothetical protein SEVIR_4G038200v4 [Setaria viridis]|uniref:Peptidase A1 domain-containing protein n=1 Tax=Setaria viridis TaxID=4556 RepID=A0A4U6UVB2_SETVI|nr:aspartic proteinase nepenthesin-2-like [Setaria viridis]TKW19712.1 hypothetical protein SEVIR_4G038200v2 [Setaria viridis]
MGRFLPLVLVAVVIFPLLMPAPLVLSAAVRPPVKINSAQAKKISDYFKKQAFDFLKDHALDVIPNVLSTPEGQKQGTKAADTAGLYVFNLSVGTSILQNITGILDITTELVWAQCACSADACLPPPGTTFDPSTSDTFAGVPCISQRCQSVIKQQCDPDPAANCTYLMQYDDYTNTTGYLGNDTFTFGQTQFPDVVFGCSKASYGDFFGASGVLGFSRGSLSLVSQLQLSWFSYLLVSDGPSPLQFGYDAVPQTENSHSTPLLNNDANPGLYYVKLTGIMIDGRQLNGIPAGTFDIQSNGSGGVFLSTTVPVTYLDEAAYNVVRKAFVSRITAEAVDGSALGLDLCYTLQPKDEMVVPKLTLVFDGTNAAMELKKYNYFFADNNTNLECLTILPSRGGSLLGSLLQTDTNMAYDIEGSRLIFETASAPTPDLKVSLMVVVQFLALALLF